MAAHCCSTKCCQHAPEQECVLKGRTRLCPSSARAFTGPWVREPVHELLEQGRQGACQPPVFSQAAGTAWRTRRACLRRASRRASAALRARAARSTSARRAAARCAKCAARSRTRPRPRMRRAAACALWSPSDRHMTGRKRHALQGRKGTDSVRQLTLPEPQRVACKCSALCDACAEQAHAHGARRSAACQLPAPRTRHAPACDCTSLMPRG
jgi:hypothetical protein